MEGEKLWQAALAELEQQLSTPTFRTWFSQTRLLSMEQTGEGLLIIVGCPNTFAQERLETYYAGQIKQLLDTISGKQTTVHFQVTTKTIPSAKTKAGPLFDDIEEPTEQEDLAAKVRKAQINGFYTFDHFIVGASNNLAYTAAQAIVMSPGHIHNPFFIYGGVGCGKTHLMHAVANAILKKQPDTKILYCSCEQFTNDLIESMKTKTTEKFRNKYRNLDLLLIDDIQFISRSEYSQEEFFNTFNTLYNAGHQIIIASDRLPEEIPKLAARLTSRFQGGVIVDVQPPDLEMRLAILQSKAQEFNIEIPDDTCLFIAENYRSNTRELEGALKRVIAAASIKNEPLSLTFVQQILGLANKELKRRITPRQIVEAVSKVYNVPLKELTGSKRRHEIVVARQAAMYILRTKLNLQYERIAEVLGGKDHTTIMYGVEKVENLMENDGETRGRLDDVMSALGRG